MGSDGKPLLVVKEASLSLREGEVVALVGRTGSGKSTVAQMIVGLLEPDAGEVLLEGSSLAAQCRQDEKRVRRRLQLLAQDPYDALSPRLSVLELVREPLDLLVGGSMAERTEKARSAVAHVRLPTTAEFLAKRTHELSGGQLQRVAIARALTLRPKVLIADEPVSMLDPSEQARLIRLLKDLQSEYGMGLLLISHDIALVRKVADRMVVLHEGTVVEAGPTEEVIAAPRALPTQQLLAAAVGKAED
ncbi:MAG: ABC transporter ATP-binding protein [Chloroflexota bacterium]